MSWGHRGSTLRGPGHYADSAVEIAHVASIAICALAVTVKFYDWDFDDSFIVYRYARNIIDGNGWRFNLDESVNASTSVLNTLLNALAALPSGDPRSSAHILGGAWVFAAGILTRLLFSPRFGKSYGTVAAAAIVLLLGYNNTWGLEINLFLALCLVFVYLEARSLNTWYVLGVILLARPDGGILLACKTLVGTALQRRLPLKGLAQTALVLLPWLAVSLYTFHSVLPVTLAQKVWQGGSGFWGDDLLYYSYVSSLHWDWWIAATALFGVARMLREKSTLLYLVVFAAVQQAAYIALNVPAYHWYTASLLFAFHLSALYGLGAILESGKDFLSRILPGLPNAARLSAVFNAAVAVVLLAVSIHAYDRVTASPPVYHSNLDAYRKLSQAINQEVSPGTLAALEVGILGYYTGREILDLTGLTTAQGEFITGANNDSFFELGPRVVVIHDPAWNMERAIFDDRRFSNSYKLGGVVRSPIYQDVLFYVRR